MSTGKTVPIEFEQVVEAYRKVHQGGKATGVDNESWIDFDSKAEDHLHVIWNRLASGSYHPQAVREVEIPKKDGKTRKLGIPTLRDRIAQQVVKDYMERRIDKLFHNNSYGYRPMKSAHHALDQVRENCFKYDWVIDMDIAKFFDEISHELMLKAVEHVMEEKWVKMYVERWLKMPIQKGDGTIVQKDGKGTPQGGVISPLLANLYLHFTFDMWMAKNYPNVSFVRYADDIIVHCVSKEHAEEVLSAIRERLGEAKLAIKEEKTRIAYCKDYRRIKTYENVSFDFLGFSYQPRPAQSQFSNKSFLSFTPEISKSNQKKIIEVIKDCVSLRNTQITIEQIAFYINPKLKGWILYYGRYGKNRLRLSLMHLDLRLLNWVRKKYRLNNTSAYAKLQLIKLNNPKLFYHWEKGICYFKRE